MQQRHFGKQSVRFPNRPAVLSYASVGGKKESEGPLGDSFDYRSEDTTFSQPSWEKAESKMQQIALDTAREKIGLHNRDLDALFAGDLLNQCIGSSFPLRGTEIPYFGLYGACSTMAEGLALAAVLVDGGYAGIAGAVTSSHFASAERQYRFPLVYGGQRTPTAQWTVTGAGCMLLGGFEGRCRVEAATFGQVVDLGIRDANNMGAAMAPAAYATIRGHFDDLGIAPEDYDLIVTGDLGMVGSQILREFFLRDGVDLASRHADCGCLIFDRDRQDVHAGGSGCGCCASVLCGHLMDRMTRGEIGSLLFCATGALLSPLSTQQGESIPGICHAVAFRAERR